MSIANPLTRNAYKVAWLHNLPRPDPVLQADAPDYGFDYYVDSVRGNDASHGHSSDVPIKTIAELFTRGMVAGTRIGLARGSHWREMITAPYDNMTFGAYGTGAAPLLDASDVIDPSSWIKTAGRTNIYEITLAGMSAVGITLCGVNVWEDDVQHTYYSSLANLDAATTLPGYFVANPGTATPTLYINASGANKHPGYNGKTYEYSKRDNGIYCADARLGTKITGIWARRGYTTGGCIRVGPQSTITDCLVTDGNKYSMFIRDGCTVSGCTIQNGHHPTEATIFQLLYNQSTPTGLGITISDSIFGWSSSSVPRFGSCSIFGGHINVSGDFGTVTYSGNTITNAGFAGFNGSGMDTLVFQDNTFTNCRYTYIIPATTCTITGDTVASSTASQRVLWAESVPANITISGCNFSLTGTASSGYVYINAAVTLTVQDTTITSTAIAFNVYCGSAGANLTLRRNTHHIANNATFYNFIAGALGMIWVSDYNTFDYSNAFSMAILGVIYNNFALYQAGTGQDAHSTAS